jgi:cobalt/nickel transport system permease protein
VALQFGSFGVVIETVASGVSELPWRSFALLMQPVHLGIGIVEGLVTAAVVSFVRKAQPEILDKAPQQERQGPVSRKGVLAVLGGIALVTGLALSWFASSHPDGLEWSVARLTGSEEIGATEEGLHGAAGRVQEKLSFLPDYGFRSVGAEGEGATGERDAWPAVDGGKSFSGIVGGLVTLLLAGAIGWFLRRRVRAV